MRRDDATGGERRDGERYILDAPLRALTRLTLAAAGDAAGGSDEGPTEAALVDFSRLGFRFRTVRRYDPGSRLACRLVLSTVDEQALAFEAEVRWCLRLGGDRYEGGARILGGAPEARLVVFERFLRYHRASAPRESR